MSIILSLAGDNIPDDFLAREGYRQVARSFRNRTIPVFHGCEWRKHTFYVFPVRQVMKTTRSDSGLRVDSWDVPIDSAK